MTTNKQMTRYLSILVFASLVCARAEVLTLRDGTKVTGNWLGGDSKQIRFLVNDQIQKYPPSDVSEVNFGPEPAPPPGRTSIKLGQTINEVEAALGKPALLFDHLPGQKKIYIYPDPPVKITFQDGKVVDTL